VSYSLAEKELMTAIMRDDFLNERKVKARRFQNRKLIEDAVTTESDNETPARPEDDGEFRITYTGEEDQLMAEILRDDFLSERRARARKCQRRGAAQDKGVQ
ncbi:hypothetical protein MAR_008993, partial [Mya arenaria]